MRIEFWRDFDNLYIKIVISDAFSIDHFFAVQEFVRKFGDLNVSLSNRLLILADFVKATLEKE